MGSAYHWETRRRQMVLERRKRALAQQQQQEQVHERDRLQGQPKDGQGRKGSQAPEAGIQRMFLAKQEESKERKRLREECQAETNAHTWREAWPKPGPALVQQQLPLPPQPSPQSRRQGTEGLNQSTCKQILQGAPMPGPQLDSMGTQYVAGVFNAAHGFKNSCQVVLKNSARPKLTSTDYIQQW